MNEPNLPPPLPPSQPERLYSEPPGSEPSVWKQIKKLFGPVIVVFMVILKFGAKLKFIILPVLKFFPVILKTGGTMILSIAAYSVAWGAWFAVSFVVLIFVHECGHLVAARSLGLKAGAPVFIPFMGAFIALKDAPKDAWTEAWVGIGGPLLGTVGAAVCELIFLATGNPMFRGLAYTGFFLNLFNLAPIGFLDGGRIVTALSPWLWVVGAAIMGFLMYLRPSFMVGLILVLSLPRLWSLFRQKSDEEKRFFEISPGKRLIMAGLYFGLIAFLMFGMHYTHIVM